MQLTQFTDYSLRVLLHLAAHPGELATIDEISQGFKVKKNHLVKVVNRLVHDGYVQSIRGRNGGIALSRPLSTYRIGEIVRRMEPQWNLVECFDPETNTCPIIGKCGLEIALYKARKCFFDTLDQYTLADFMNSKKAHALDLALGQKKIPRRKGAAKPASPPRDL